MTDYLSESHYTVLTFEHLFIVNNHENLHTLLQLTTASQPLIVCDSNQLLDVEINKSSKVYLILLGRISL